MIVKQSMSELGFISNCTRLSCNSVALDCVRSKKDCNPVCLRSWCTTVEWSIRTVPKHVSQNEFKKEKTGEICVSISFYFRQFAIICLVSGL